MRFRRLAIASGVGWSSAAIAWSMLCVSAASACREQPVNPFRLEGNFLTVDNRTSEAWRDVEIWLNSYYRVTTPSIPAGARFQTTLDLFTEGFGRRFDFRRAQIRDLRLKARLPDGRPIERQKAFATYGLDGLAETMKGKR